MSEPTMCEATVSEPPWHIHEHACSRRSKTYVDNHGYPRALCTQHAKQYADNPRGCEFSWGWSR